MLEWGGSKLAAAIARELTRRARGGAAAPRASRSSRRTPRTSRPTAAANGPARPRTGELQALARELVASLEYYQGQPGSLPISEILLAGGTSRIPGLAAELERLTRVRVRLADPLARVDRQDPSIEERDDLASLAVAIGLGVED